MQKEISLIKTQLFLHISIFSISRTRILKTEYIFQYGDFTRLKLLFSSIDFIIMQYEIKYLYHKYK